MQGCKIFHYAKIKSTLMGMLAKWRGSARMDSSRWMEHLQVQVQVKVEVQGGGGGGGARSRRRCKGEARCRCRCRCLPTSSGRSC